MKRKLLKTVLLTTLPVMAGYLAIGIGFGILLKVNGYGLWWAIGMSVFIYAGAMQYVGVSLLSGGASLLTVGLTTLMVNARHLFYGITMVDRYKGAGLKKPYLMHALTDETYSLVCDGKAPEGVNAHIYYLLVSAFNQAYWVIGSIIGSLIGSVIPFDTAGIDFAMTALFITVFLDQWKNTKQHSPAIIGVCIAVLCLLLFGQEHFLIPTLLAITAALTLLRKKLEKEAARNGSC